MNNSSLSSKCFWVIMEFSMVTTEPESKQNQTVKPQWIWTPKYPPGLLKPQI